jgi:GNAT superfamily N-acetyltransferase
MHNTVVADLDNPAHAEAVVSLLNGYALDPMGGGRGLSDAVKRNLIAEIRKRPQMLAILALVDGEPAGLAICIEGFSTFACQPLLNIHDLVVAPAFRGRRLSQTLLAKVEELALERGCCKLTLEVLEGNRVARSAYRAFGFEGYELDPTMGKAVFWQKKLAVAATAE